MLLSSSDAFHLLVAAALTYVLGFERDLRGATAGDRVFALVGAGGGVVGILAAHGAAAALTGAITGIGFIGGGLMFREPSGTQQIVRGMTTAAAIFAGAAIGAVAGEGRLQIAVEATVLVLFVLELRHIRLLRVLDGRRWAPYFVDDDKPVRHHLWRNIAEELHEHMDGHDHCVHDHRDRDHCDRPDHHLQHANAKDEARAPSA